MKPDIALTIAGSDSGGGAGIQADLKTFAALEVHGLSVITSATAQNTRGVEGIEDLPAEFVGKQIDTVAKDFDVKWAKTGMVSSSEIIGVIKERTKEHGIELVVDPVMTAGGGASLLKEGAFQGLKDLLSEAKLTTPNLIEASKLAEMKIETVDEMKTAAKKISELGPEGVLIKGGHLDTSKIHNLLFYEDKFTEFEESRVPISEVHGTGCTFSAAITAELAKGLGLQPAVEKAGDFMIDAVRGRLEIGGGVGTVNPMARAWKVTGDGDEIREVQRAAKNLVNSPEFGRLIPEVGTNIAMAPKGSQKTEDVIGLTGRIVKVNDKPYLSGFPAPGGSEHVANFVLTAEKHDPRIRSGMNIRFSEEILGKCRELSLEISSFDRRGEPPDVKTMSWGAEKAIEKFGGVPDVIYDRGAVGKEPMLRILGEKATDVSEIALRIAKS